MKKYFSKYVLALMSILLLSLVFYVGCGGGGDDGGGSSNTEAITSKDSAQWLVENLSEGVTYNCVVSEVNHGTHNGTVINEGGGTAIVSGSYDYDSNISCGSNCVRSETDADLTIVYLNFKCMANSNVEGIVTGTVNYSDNTWSRQSGTSYSSGGSVSIEGSDVSYRARDVDGSFDYSDTISFNASGNSAGYLSGWCRPSNGNTYDF